MFYNLGFYFFLSKVDVCLERKDSTNLTGLSGNYQSTAKVIHGLNHAGIHRSQSSWPVRNGLPSPWLQRYKIKKRATTSYALQTPEESRTEDDTKPNQKYVTLSSAVILDSF